MILIYLLQSFYITCFYVLRFEESSDKRYGFIMIMYMVSSLWMVSIWWHDFMTIMTWWYTWLYDNIYDVYDDFMTIYI